MAKLTGPLFSNTASGSFGPRLTFSQRRSGQQVRFQRAQKDVITAGRTAQRALYILAVDAWDTLDDVIKNIFKSLAVGENFTGYNLFVKLHIAGEIFGSDTSIYGDRNYGIMVYGKE